MTAGTNPPIITAHDVSVVIPVHRGGIALEHCLRSLAAAEPRPGQVIVVADGPGDGSWRIVSAYAAQLITLPRRAGPGTARNTGACAARGSILFFVDADVAIAPDAVGQVVDALNEHPQWAAVFGSYDDTPGATNFIAQYKGLLNHYVHQHARPEGFTFWSGLGAIRKEAFLGLGGFDPAARLEDVDLGYRMNAAGLRVGIRKTLLATHLKRWGAVSLICSDVFDRALPWTQLIWRYRIARNDLNLDAANRLSMLCVFSLVATLILSASRPTAGFTLAGVLIAALLVLNRSLYALFLRRGGRWFLLGALLWHWFYFFYGGIAFGVGTIAHFVRPSHAPKSLAPLKPTPEPALIARDVKPEPDYA